MAQQTLRAPIDGTIETVLFEPGEVVTPGQPIVGLSGAQKSAVAHGPAVTFDHDGTTAGVFRCLSPFPTATEWRATYFTSSSRVAVSQLNSNIRVSRGSD